MSNRIIEKLLNGAKVDWKPLGEVAELKRGQVITAKDTTEGNIPVISGGQKPAYYTGNYNREGETITVAGSGAYAGFLMYWNEPIFLGDAFSVKPYLEVLITKYVYHFLLSRQQWIFNLKKGSGVPHVYPKDLSSLLIPIPPLSTQEKIVKILDKFTELEATLEAELALRKKQYQYYRETLLTFPQNLDRGGYNEITKALCQSGKVVFKSLGEVCDIYLGLTYTPNYVDNGIKFISAQNTSNDFLDLKNVKYISKDDYYKITSNAKPKKGDILFTRVGSNLGHPVIIDVEDELCIFVSLGYLRVKDGILNTYVKHWMNTKLFWDQVSKSVHGSAKINLNTGWLKKFTIAVPPISEQQKIVEILDKFDRLTNSISEGLPKEIELRRKQYEYYREQLLDFPK
ncbi:restriction endonuclease subunit S [Mannheimia indoligenes]|uniref:Restriction endonuclease subunit S n=1 Tax=Mannheimia indoligenes TaxID=3103145 RepID=A0ABU7ZGY4_9PAST